MREKLIIKNFASISIREWYCKCSAILIRGCNNKKKRGKGWMENIFYWKKIEELWILNALFFFIFLYSAGGNGGETDEI